MKDNTIREQIKRTGDPLLLAKYDAGRIREWPPTPPPAPHNPGGYIAKEKPETSYDVIELWNWYKVWLGVIIVLALAFAALALVSAI